MAIRRIGQIFVDMGFVSDDQLEMLLEEQQQRPGTLLGKIALELNLLNEEQLVQALAEQMGMQVVELGDYQIPPDVLKKLTESMAQLYRAVPIHFEGNRLTVAMGERRSQGSGVRSLVSTHFLRGGVEVFTFVGRAGLFHDASLGVENALGQFVGIVRLAKDVLDRAFFLLPQPE